MALMSSQHTITQIMSGDIQYQSAGATQASDVHEGRHPDHEDKPCGDRVGFQNMDVYIVFVIVMLVSIFSILFNRTMPTNNKHA